MGNGAMNKRILAILVTLTICAPYMSRVACATGVPVGGFLPMVGIGLTDEFDDDFNTFAVPSDSPSGNFLGYNGNPHFDVAILDTGAAVSLLTAQAFDDFNMDGPYPGEPDGFEGTEEIPIGGATGQFFAPIHDPLGLYATGLQNRTGTAPLALNQSAMRGQTNTSMISLPADSELPNVLGLPYASQYATKIRSDQPQIFSLGGNTVRTPSIEFLPLGTGGSQGIVRRAPMQLNPGTSFQQAPFWFYNFEEFDLDNPHENPSQPTLIQGAMFLNVDVENEGEELNNFQFFFDTGADVTVVSELNAARLGFDTILDQPDFTVAVVGSGGTTFDVPGFFVEEFTVQAIGGNITLSNVPVVVLDVTDPSDPGNVVDGIVGMNLLAGRNVVIDPKPSLGGGGVGPSVYISDPVTTEKYWTTATVSSSFAAGANWSGGAAPTTLDITNVRHVSGGDQKAVVTSDATIWELNISSDSDSSVTVRIENGARLTSFSGMNVEVGGVLDVANGVVDAQFVEVFGGTLRGGGRIETGSGPVPGQVENRGGIIGPGDGVGTLTVEGRFASSEDATLQIELAGLTPAIQYDQLIVEGNVVLGGTLQVSLANLGGGAFTPAAGDSFTIITATDGIGGVFDSLLAPAGYKWLLDYTDVAVTLSVGLSGDYNDDGVVNAADYTLWRDTMGAVGEMLAADGNGDGKVDHSDYTIWKNHFGESLGGSSAAAVPEPTSLALLFLAALFTVRVRSVTSLRCGASSCR
jgi:hypothetical protein